VCECVCECASLGPDYRMSGMQNNVEWAYSESENVESHGMMLVAMNIAFT